MQLEKETRAGTNLRAVKQIAIILAHRQPWSQWFDPTKAKVGTLPVLLRAILGVKSTHPDRIIVVFNRETGPSVRRALFATGRFPGGVELTDVHSGTSLQTIVRSITQDSGVARILLVAGDRTYQPSLHRMVSEWNGESSALELATGIDPVGLFALPYDTALALGADIDSHVVTMRDLHRWIARNALVNETFVDYRLIERGRWQRISMPQDCAAAEKKLDRWLVKPTDGVFARMNRRISIPISRQLIKYPITPNMVSIFTLGVSFAAGVFYGLGGYWNSLLAAVLSVWASILDGCDGEVARLKLQATDFGCWLETACDYLYYFFIFAGIPIGLARSTGNRMYLGWGLLLLFGAAATMLLAWIERRRLSGKHPEQFLAVWQKNAERRSSNPLLYLGRHLEFIIRRCFLPYALLGFALLNLNSIALFMAAIGANIAWIVSFTSRLSFSPHTNAEAASIRETKPLAI